MKYSSTQHEDGIEAVDPKAKKIKLGKKELQQKEAEEHDDTFSPATAPKLVVNNK